MKSSLHKPPLLIAHRGDTISFPENTLEGFLSAFEKGADGVELDIHFYNNEIIVVHNYLFDGSKSYPRLEDILKRIHLKGRIEIEIKEFDTKILQPLKKVLSKFPHADFELTTSEIPLAPYIKEQFSQIPFGLILQDFFFQDWMAQEFVEQKLIGWGKLTKADRLHIPLKILERFGQDILVGKLHTAGFIVHSHIFNTEEQNDSFIKISKWNVDQCTFDNIDGLNLKVN